MSRPYLRRTPGIAGIDEAGRGPLAGPVVAAAVVLPKTFSPCGLNDSKLLNAVSRERLARHIQRHARWAVAYASVEEIDRINILQATLLAMKRALAQLGEDVPMVYVDGNILPAPMPCSAKAIVDGDAKYACIAAASVLAKTERDRHMAAVGEEFPLYGFHRHFGYATPEHRAALREHGPCPLHRRSFAPCRDADQLCLTFAE